MVLSRGAASCGAGRGASRLHRVSRSMNPWNFLDPPGLFMALDAAITARSLQKGQGSLRRTDYFYLAEGKGYALTELL